MVGVDEPCMVELQLRQPYPWEQAPPPCRRSHTREVSASATEKRISTAVSVCAMAGPDRTARSPVGREEAPGSFIAGARH